MSVGTGAPVTAPAAASIAPAAGPPTVPSPHIGGGDDSSAWTGGPNQTQLNYGKETHQFQIGKHHPAYCHQGTSGGPTHRTGIKDLQDHPHLLGELNPILYEGARPGHHLLCLRRSDGH
jgi:hypothetical protein